MVLSPGDDVSELDDTGAGTNEAVFSDAESNEAGTADFPGGDDHLTNSQGFLVPTAASAVLPVSTCCDALISGGCSSR